MEKAWATIRIPSQLMNTIRKYAAKAKMEEWRFLAQAVSSYVFFYTNPTRFQRERTKLEKAAWYIIKLVSTVEAFKSNPANEFQQLMGIIQQIETNLNIDLSLLRKAVMDYWSNFKGERKEMQQYTATINSSLKIAAIEILETVLTG
jgi:predicted metal-dependent peptidase